MTNPLTYPFDSHYLMRRRKAIKRELLSQDNLIEKHIAILGGSTTHDIIDMLELFLLSHGIRPVFFESEYAQYWQDAMFENEELRALGADIIFIHTTARNITAWPEPADSAETIDDLLEKEAARFISMWDKLSADYHCPIIQNNFEYPGYRLMGNQDAFNIHGRVNFVTRLNERFYQYARTHDQFYINDINYQSADYGLKAWSDPFAWHMYKYALALDAIPTLAYNVANIIKSIYGKNKKAIALDLDNTLWGGIVGDDGVEGIEIGQETSLGQAYAEFQEYLLALKKEGILLNVISKNEEAAAAAGLNHPEMVLKPDDFISVRANWDPKSRNLIEVAEELNLLPESFVLVDDNPAEREIVRQQVPGVGIPELTKAERYIEEIDRAGYFETTVFSKDDLNRSEMYRENAARAKQLSSFSDYSEYLLSLKMEAEIGPFIPLYMARIAQLTNKSNQFNLTTRRYTQEEIEETAADDRYISLYGKLTDCFGDNGVVSITIGKEREEDGVKVLDIILWLMSCRVLKRDMEYAMMDELVCRCLRRGISAIYGYYYPTAKNAMVRDFYAGQGFILVSEDDDGNRVWKLDIASGYENQNHVISVNKGDQQ